jgi:Domain of unknown function (DUF4399)
MNFYKISTHISILSLLVFSLSFAACMNCCRPKKRVFFENLKDNQFLPENFQIRFGFENLQVKPAGVDIENKSAGHFHILIDEPMQSIPEGEIVPWDDNHIHYGKGQTEAVLTLSPGKHTLTLQFADGAHRSYGKVLSSTITVNVKAKANSL